MKIKAMFFLLICTLFFAACGKEESVMIQEITEISTAEQNTETMTVAEADLKEPIGKVYVYLCGAVLHPGVYEVESGTRLFEVIALSGGFTLEAACDYVNQAREVTDGEQIRIPTAEEAEEAKTTGNESYPASVDAQPKQDTKIDINKASKEMLCTIPGVGESKAETIIAYREEKGYFQRIEDIKKVNGIKDGMYEKMKDYITVSK